MAANIIVLPSAGIASVPPCADVPALLAAWKPPTIPTDEGRSTVPATWPIAAIVDDSESGPAAMEGGETREFSAADRR